jgi:hypothetical protein
MDTLSVQVVVKSNALQNARSLMESFRAAGFSVGAMVGNNFSLTAPVSVFESLFGAAHVTAAIAGTESVLPLNTLPSAAQNAVEAIVVPHRPDFGPGSYSR